MIETQIRVEVCTIDVLKGLISEVHTTEQRRVYEICLKADALESTVQCTVASGRPSTEYEE